MSRFGAISDADRLRAHGRSGPVSAGRACGTGYRRSIGGRSESCVLPQAINCYFREHPTVGNENSYVCLTEVGWPPFARRLSLALADLWEINDSIGRAK